jgi:translation initiation factor 2 subunit 1
LTSIGIKDKIAKKIEELIIEKIKPPIVSINGIFKISTKESKGIEIIKKVLNNLVDKGISVTYLGAPKYKINIQDKDYKKAEIRLKEAIESSLQLAKKLKAEAEFNRKNA